MDEVPSYFTHLSRLKTPARATDLIIVQETVSVSAIHNFIISSQPILFKYNSNVISKDWLYWRRNDRRDGTTLNFDFIKASYGHLQVPITLSGVYGSNSTTMKLSDYLNYLTSLNHPPQDEKEVNHDPLQEQQEVMYLKDWHYQLALPDAIISDPMEFQPDLLNLFWDHASGRRPIQCNKSCPDNHRFTQFDSSASDYRFLYLGPQSSSTSLHTDVMKSHSWSANIVGEKKWWLISPDQEDELIKLGLVQVHGHPDSSIPTDFKHIEQYPSLRIIQFVQKEGETVFIPSGWWHQVENVSHPTLSVNCNWFTPHTLIESHTSLEHDLLQVQHSIRDDFTDDIEMLSHAQVILLANSGLNWTEWIRVLLFYSCSSHVVFEGQYRGLMHRELGFVTSRLRLDDWIKTLPPTDETIKNLDHLARQCELYML
jgi:hypothetical protein